MHEFILGDLAQPENLPDLARFDVILLLDILEHLDEPERFLDILRAKTRRKRPKIIITAPNIAFVIIRLQLLLGQFNYSKEGILDLTHKRLFTFAALKKLCHGAGYQIVHVAGIPAPFPKALGDNRLSRGLLALNNALMHVSKGLFAYQILLEVQPTPVVHELLSYAFDASAQADPPSQSSRP